MGNRGPKLGTGGRPRTGKVSEALTIYKSKSRQRVRNISEFLHILSRTFVHIQDFPNTDKTRVSTPIRMSWDILLGNVNSKKKIQKIEEIMMFLAHSVERLKNLGVWIGHDCVPLVPDEIARLDKEWSVISTLFYQLKNPESFGEFKPLGFSEGVDYPLPLDSLGEKEE